MKSFTLNIMLSFSLIATKALAQNATATQQAVTTAPLTTLPSTTSFDTTVTQSVPGGTTSTVRGGSVTILPVSETWIVPNPTAAPEVAGEYKLRTKVLDRQRNRFDGLYIGAWALHNGYYADAAFTRNKTEAAKFYLNGTGEQVDFGTGDIWSLTVNYNTVHSRWFSVEVHRKLDWNYGTFWHNATGLQWTPNSSPGPHNGTLGAVDAYFGGWLVCEWYHGVPQLFYKVGIFNDTKLTSCCADVLLLPDYFH